MIPVITVREYEPIFIGERFSFEKKTISRLQASLLEKFERSQGKSVFKWGNNKIIPQQWIGVVSVANLQVEILPKLSQGPSLNIRRNLLYMLSIAQEVPFRIQDIGTFDTQRHTFLEVFIKVFIDKLKYVFKFGMIHQYESIEDNVGFLKGKLVVGKHLRRNMFNSSKFYISYDEFSSQNIPNRILKATITKLARITKLTSNKKELHLLNSFLDGVDEKTFSISDFNKLNIPRTVHHSYKEIFEICRVFWRDESHNLNSGSSDSFSLLFDMNVIYEKFIQNLLIKYKTDLFDETYQVSTNRNGNSRFLLRNHRNQGAYKLLPDNCIYDTTAKKIVLIIDTKWKLLDESRANAGVSQQDIYQMYAYAREFDCNKIILLYPNTVQLPTNMMKYYNESVEKSRIEIIIETINLNYKFPDEIRDLICDIKRILEQ